MEEIKGEDSGWSIGIELWTFQSPYPKPSTGGNGCIDAVGCLYNRILLPVMAKRN
jgi:hypothetical protein